MRQPFLTKEQRKRAWVLKQRWLSKREIARELDCTLEQLRVHKRRGRKP